MQGSDPSTSTITFAVVMPTTGRIPRPERQEKRPYQKEARKINSTCTSSSGCIHYEFVDGSVQVEYIPAHTSHKRRAQTSSNAWEHSYTEQEVAVKLSMRVQVCLHPLPHVVHKGITYSYIYTWETVGDREKRDSFDEGVSKRHFLSKSDINNIQVKVKDGMIKPHKTTATIMAL